MKNGPENRVVRPIIMAAKITGAGILAWVQSHGSAGEVNAQNPFDIPTPVGIIATATATPTLTSLERAKQTAADLERKVATEKERVATQAMIDRLNQQFEALQKTPTPAVPTPTPIPAPTSTPTTLEILQKTVADLEREAAEARAKVAANDRIDRLNNQIAAFSNTPTPKPDLEATKTALTNQAAREVAAIQATATASAQPNATPTSRAQGLKDRVAGKEQELADVQAEDAANKQLAELQGKIDAEKNPSPINTQQLLAGAGILAILVYAFRRRLPFGRIPLINRVSLPGPHF